MSMRSWKARMTALGLALCTLIACTFSGETAAAAEAAEACAVRIPYGEDVSGYDPARDGYYGLLPVQYEEAQDDEGLKTMAKAYMPVLVSGGHLYIADRQIPSVLGLTVKKGDSTLLVSAYERHLALSSGQQKAYFFAGDYADCYEAVTLKLSAAPVYVDGTVWVPFQDLCILFELGMHQEKEGEDRFITVYDPNETVIDVLAFLYNDSGACKTAYTSGDLALLSGSSAAAQLAAKLLDGDATAWAALALSAFGFDEKGHELLLKQLADDLTVDLMCVIPDESMVIAEQSANYISDVMSLIQTEYDVGANAAVDMDLMDAVVEARISSGSLVNDPRWFSEALDKIQVLTEQKKALAALNTGLDNVLTGVKTVFGMLQTAATYASVDEISQGGVGAICANRAALTDSSPIVLDEIESYAAFMRSGEVNYSLYDYVAKNVGSWVLDGISASCPVFKLMQLAAHLVPALSEGIDATHSFQISMLAIPLQNDVERILQAELKAYPARKAEGEQFKALSETAYIYLKTCYIARNQASSALGLSSDELSRQQGQMEFLLEKMAVLSVNYAIAPENIYSKAYRLEEIDDSVLIDTYTKKMVLEVSGEVRKASDKSPVEDAHCEITDLKGNLCGIFDGTPGGQYQTLYLPVYQPAGCLPYERELAVSASLRFTSPTVDGEDTVQAQGVPGAGATSVETAYLEAGGFAMASSLGEIDGTLYSVNTSYIHEDEGVQALKAPADEANDYYVAKFAYYGGKIYYVEKTPGTDDMVRFRLCRCEKDGSGRTVLVDNGDIDWSGLYFVIENDLITWSSYDFRTNTTSYRTYSIAEGKMTDAPSSAKPLTELVLGSYEQGAVRLAAQDDGTWALYQMMAGSGSEKALSYSLVTVDENGHTSTSGQEIKGHITGAMRIFALHNGYAYISAYEGNDGILYKVNLKDAKDIQEIGRHKTAGGGDAFFNY